MALLGGNGFKKLARINHERAGKLADALSQIEGVSLVNESFFNEFVIEVPSNANDLVDALAKKGVVAGLAIEDNKLLVAATEMTTDQDIAIFVEKLTEELG
jgi:glycine dehydrogenase subunit 1